MLLPVVIFVCGLASSLVALPPLPPMPTLPPLPSKSADLGPASAPLAQADPAMSTPVGSAPVGVSVAPVMLPSGHGEIKIGDGGSDSRSKNLEVLLKSLADIEKNLSGFQSFEQDLDAAYGALDKKLDVFYSSTDMFIGQTAAYVEDVQGEFKVKDVQMEKLASDSAGDLKKVMGELRTSLGDISTAVASVKEARSSLSRDEDAMRQALVDLKKNRVEFTGFYSKATSIKNELLSKEDGDGKAQLDQMNDLSKKSQELFDKVKNKDGVAFRDLMKKIEDALAKLTSEKTALSQKIDDIKKKMIAFNDSEDLQQVSEQKALIKETKKSSVSANRTKERSAFDLEPQVLGEVAVASDKQAEDAEAPKIVQVDMVREVLQTIARGGHVVFAWLKNLFSSLSHAFSKDGSTHEELSQKREVLAGASTAARMSLWGMVLAVVDYAKIVGRTLWGAVYGMFKSTDALSAAEVASAQEISALNNKDDRRPILDVPKVVSEQKNTASGLSI